MSGYRIGVIGSRESWYVRRVVEGLCKAGHPPAVVFIGSVVERRLFTLASLRRVRELHGLKEVIARLWDRKVRPQPSLAPVQTLESLQARHQFELRTYDRINSGPLYLEISALKLDVLLLAGCGIVSPLIIGAAEKVLNAHPAILPGARGVDVVDWALIHGLPLGVTVHVAVPRVDAGSLIETREIVVLPNETYEELHARILELQARTLVEAGLRFVRGDAELRPNDISRSEIYYATSADDRRLARRRFRELRTTARS